MQKIDFDRELAFDRVTFDLRRIGGLEGPNNESVGYDLHTFDPVRRTQFLAGRFLAANLLRAKGSKTLHVGRDRNGAPVWPKGFTGSISHKADWCFAGVAREEDYLAIGVDLERFESLESNTWKQIASCRELNQLEPNPPLDKGQLANLLFSAKEAFFKCQYSLSNDTRVEFRDVGLKVFADINAFGVTIKRRELARKLPKQELFLGKYLIKQNLMATVCALRADP